MRSCPRRCKDRIFAVTGVNADTKGPLGFAAERYDPTENQRYFVYGIFASVIPKPKRRPSSPPAITGAELRLGRFHGKAGPAL
ncbi:hypothetical protein [Rhizobium sullae]|uniref:hypothetical protein n=1 Tax=Rhizobium sullae TaxID=50338 RepID=UPI00117A76DD|nr:hypothetical protein [Rhizobium sullae]